MLCSGALVVHKASQSTPGPCPFPCSCRPALPTNHMQSLVLASSSLTSLQLVHVPSTDGHVARVLVHAVREALGSHGAVRVLLLVGVVVALLLLLGGSGLGVRGLGGTAAAKEAADGVADGGANGNTTACTDIWLASLLHCMCLLEKSLCFCCCFVFATVQTPGAPVGRILPRETGGQEKHTQPC